MYELIQSKLQKLEKPIQVAITGIGWMGSGVVRELIRIQGTNPKILFEKNTNRAFQTLLNCGITKDKIRLVQSATDLKQGLASDEYLVASELKWIQDLEGIDCLYEATGDFLGGTQAILYALEKGIPVVNANFEVDACIGLKLARLAQNRKVLYTCSDGDQPTVLGRMIHKIQTWGFEPKIVGNCKGFLDLHQTPEGAKPFTPPHQNVNMVCAMADGTKQSLEMASLANAFGYLPHQRGMHGPKTTKRTLIEDFDQLLDLKSLKGTYTDYVTGIEGSDQGAGVFIVAKRDELITEADMKYLKKGPGPYYLFFRDEHLCYLEAISSITEICCFETASFYAKGQYADVITVAKRDLKSGEKLGHIGGYNWYGLVEKASIASIENLLPSGLAEFGTLKKPVTKNTPITQDLVDLEPNPVIQLRLEESEIAPIGNFT